MAKGTKNRLSSLAAGAKRDREQRDRMLSKMVQDSVSRGLVNAPQPRNLASAATSFDQASMTSQPFSGQNPRSPFQVPADVAFNRGQTSYAQAFNMRLPASERANFAGNVNRTGFSFTQQQSAEMRESLRRYNSKSDQAFQRIRKTSFDRQFEDIRTDPTLSRTDRQQKFLQLRDINRDPRLNNRIMSSVFSDVRAEERSLDRGMRVSARNQQIDARNQQRALVAGERATFRQQSGQIKDIMSDAGSSLLDKQNALLSLRGEAKDVKILSSIDKNIGKLVNYEERGLSRNMADQAALKKDNPLSYRAAEMFSGGKPSAGTVKTIAAAGSGLAAIAGSAVRAGTEFYKSGVSVDRQAFQNISSIQARDAGRFRDSSAVNGESLLRRMGNTILGTEFGNKNFLGMEGFRNAQAMAKAESDRQKTSDLLSGAVGAGGQILGGAAAIGGAAMMGIGSGGLAAAGALGLGAAGVGMIGSGISGLFSSPGVAQTGIFGSRRQLAARTGYANDRDQLVDQFRESQVQANTLAAEGLDRGIALRGAENSAMSIAGGRFSSVEDRLAQAYGRRAGMGFASPVDELSRQKRVLGGTAIDVRGMAGTRFGMDATQYSGLAAGLSASGGVNDRFGYGQGERLLELQASGRGSVEQIMGNISSVAKISGRGDSLQQLEKVFARGTAAGFDGSRLGQEFVQLTSELAGKTGTTDVDAVARKLSTLVSGMGGGERSGRELLAGVGAIENLSKNKYVDARLSIERSRVAAETNTAASADLLGGLGIVQASALYDEVLGATKGGKTDRRRLSAAGRQFVDQLPAGANAASLVTSYREADKKAFGIDVVEAELNRRGVKRDKTGVEAAQKLLAQSSVFSGLVGSSPDAISGALLMMGFDKGAQGSATNANVGRTLKNKELDAKKAAADNALTAQGAQSLNQTLLGELIGPTAKRTMMPGGLGFDQKFFDSTAVSTLLKRKEQLVPGVSNVDVGQRLQNPEQFNQIVDLASGRKTSKDAGVDQANVAIAQAMKQAKVSVDSEQQFNRAGQAQGQMAGTMDLSEKTVMAIEGAMRRAIETSKNPGFFEKILGKIGGE
jgi:hypothetical protein